MMIHTTVEEKSAEFFEKLRRKVYTTPKSYLDLIHLYVSSLEVKREEQMKNKRRLALGLKKLQDTNVSIADFKIKIEHLQPQLKAKNEQIMEALVEVEKDSKIANEKEKVVSEEAKVVSVKKADAQLIADDAERDLALAKPEMEAAKTAVAQLNKDSIIEIKSFPNPPKAVIMVMESIMILLGEKIDWKSIKDNISETNAFIDRLKTFNVMNTPEGYFSKVKNSYLSKPEFDIKDI
jgi:dynein heavy chain, axonemal